MAEWLRRWFLEIKRKLRLANFVKGMWFGLEEPFLWEERFVTSQETAAEEFENSQTMNWFVLTPGWPSG